MVTGSHNPPEYNGLKMMVAGDTLAAEAIQDLRRVVESGDVRRAGEGRRPVQADISEAYLDRIASDVKLARPMTHRGRLRQRLAGRVRAARSSSAWAAR